MTTPYVNPLSVLRVTSLMGAVILNESPGSKQHKLLIARVLVLDRKTREMWADPAVRPVDRLAVLRSWRAIYREVRDALIDAGLVTNARMKSGTVKS